MELQESVTGAYKKICASKKNIVAFFVGFRKIRIRTLTMLRFNNFSEKEKVPESSIIGTYNEKVDFDRFLIDVELALKEYKTNYEFNNHISPNALQEKHRRLVKLILSQKKEFSVPEIARRMQVTNEAVYRSISDLLASNDIVNIGYYPNGRKAYAVRGTEASKTFRPSNKELIMDIFTSANNALSSCDIAKKAKVELQTVRSIIAQLKRDGFIVKIGDKRDARYVTTENRKAA